MAEPEQLLLTVLDIAASLSELAYAVQLAKYVHTLNETPILYFSLEVLTVSTG